MSDSATSSSAVSSIRIASYDSLRNSFFGVSVCWEVHLTPDLKVVKLLISLSMMALRAGRTLRSETTNKDGGGKRCFACVKDDDDYTMCSV